MNVSSFQFSVSNFWKPVDVLAYYDMKYLLLAIFVYFFVAMPMRLLETTVVPQLNQIAEIYMTAESRANAVAGISE